MLARAASEVPPVPITNAQPEENHPQLAPPAQLVPSSRRGSGRRRAVVVWVVLALAAIVAAAVIAPVASGATAAPNQAKPVKGTGATKPPDGLGVQPGAIKHVWLIILENKSYDTTFTGLNKNTYLWQTLPKQGVLLKNYYGTGHDSQDNYITLASGQAPQPDVQNDCPYYDRFSGHVDKAGGSLKKNKNYGQMVSAAGVNAAAGQNGCVYPKSVPTLFNQLSANKLSWKGYAQDLGNPETPAGSPRTASAPSTAVRRSPSPGRPARRATRTPGRPTRPTSTSPSTSRSRGLNRCCRRATATPSTSPTCSRLPTASTTTSSASPRRPAFSWITPNNCSDGHDAVCAGNNLSGGWSNPNTPKAPANYTGGLYSADLFLEHVIPMIERSPAFRDGGLIDITFDEGFPPFTYTGNSFANSTIVAPDAATSIATDSAGQTLFGKTVHSEPTGPNVPLAKNAAGDELYPGPGQQPVPRSARRLRGADGPQAARWVRACWAGPITCPGRAPTPARRRLPAAPRSPTRRSR